jgi:hypothetical protein
VEFSPRLNYQDKDLETAKRKIGHANLVINANHYSIASYRADNKNLRVVLPGETRAQHE